MPTQPETAYSLHPRPRQHPSRRPAKRNKHAGNQKSTPTTHAQTEGQELHQEPAAVRSDPQEISVPDLYVFTEALPTWTAQPNPATYFYVPRSFRKRFAALFNQQAALTACCGPSPAWSLGSSRANTMTRGPALPSSGGDSAWMNTGSSAWDSTSSKQRANKATTHRRPRTCQHSCDSNYESRRQMSSRSQPTSHRTWQSRPTDRNFPECLGPGFHWARD